jgi:hypothetical protein
MSNEQNENFRVVEQRIPISERIAMAIAQFFATLALVFTATILLPVNFIRTLFTSKRQVIEVNAEGLRGLPGPSNPFGTLDNEEPWMKEHREQFGNEDD